MKTSIPHDAGPAHAVRWLSRPDVIRSIGAKEASRLRKQFQRQVDRAVDEACSSARIDTALAGGESVYVPGMVRGAGLVRYGEGRPSQRWTPAIAVDHEDRYDRMDVIEACQCKDPPSGTGVNFQMMQIRGSRVRTQRTRVVSQAKARRLARAAENRSCSG